MTSEITLTKTPKWADVEVTGNVPTNDVTRMSVDSSGAAHIMSLLTDLYSDQELAVLREYTSNGIDAHRAAGQTAPIEVHLPSALSPNFIVQDYGTGMSLDDIKYIYSSYGASTKRNDMNQIGAFGLGCKSALTLTQQFTIVSIKDKKRTVAHILRGSDGVGEVSIISHTDTQSPNGVKVTIPVPDHSTFVSKANSFFYTWKSDDVLVNGEKPKTLFDLDHITFTPSNGTALGAHLIRPAKKRGWYDQFEKGLYFMLSGIRYEVDLGNSAVRGRVNSDLRDILAQTALIIEVPIGAVDLVPSREALRYSPRTVSNIELFLKGMLEDVHRLIVADVVDAPTRRDALIRSKFWSDLTRGLGRLDFKWGTEDIPRTISLQNLHYVYMERSGRAESGYMQRRTDYAGDDVDVARQISVYNLAANENVYYAVDSRDAAEIRSYGNMFRDYLLSQDITLSNASFFHLKKQPTSEWFKALTTKVSIDTMLEKAKAYRAAQRAAKPKDPGQPKVEVFYDMIRVEADGSVNVETNTAASTIPAGSYYINRGTGGPNIDDPLAYFIKHRGYANYTSDIENNKHVKFVLSQALVGGGTIVIVDRARTVDALKNRTSNVVDTDFYALYRATASRLIGGDASNNAAISQVLTMYTSGRISPREFAQGGLFPIIGTVDDPEVVALVTLLNGKTTYTRERVRYLRTLSGSALGVDETAKKTDALLERINATLDKYPLLGVLSGKAHKRSAMLDDLVEYLNTKYGKANKA